MSPSRPSPRGVTLIESMAAMVVFTIGIIGVMQMNVLASRQNNLARSRTIAAKIARDVADAFERLPFNHPLLSQPTGLDINTDEFYNMDNPDGLVRMENVEALTATGIDMERRPFMGASAAAFSSEGDNTFYEVAWRVARILNPERNNEPDQKRILVMVRYPTTGTSTRTVATWAIKADPEIVTGDPQTAEF